jgi:hypothetical protein
MGPRVPSHTSMAASTPSPRSADSTRFIRFRTFVRARPSVQSRSIVTPIPRIRQPRIGHMKMPPFWNCSTAPDPDIFFQKPSLFTSFADRSSVKFFWNMARESTAEESTGAAPVSVGAAAVSATPVLSGAA